MPIDAEATTRRIPLLGLFDRPRQSGAARFLTPLVLPYSVLRVDSNVYFESNNSPKAMLEGGGAHTLPSYGRCSPEEFADKKVIGEDGKTVVHRFDWI